mmetsp:Transcript_51553/g.149718  ORF Transcript_51553/g.149718 Transcript_51553/m.149718 type:complete len:302 (+) Transcript_51553:65-970(+)
MVHRAPGRRLLLPLALGLTPLPTAVRLRSDGVAPGSEQASRQCAAHFECAALGLQGACCPAEDGLVLACCGGPGAPRSSDGLAVPPPPPPGSGPHKTKIYHDKAEGLDPALKKYKVLERVKILGSGLTEGRWFFGEIVAVNLQKNTYTVRVEKPIDKVISGVKAEYLREIKADCPPGYEQIVGDVPRCDHFGRGCENYKASVEHCGEDCSNRTACLSFEWSPSGRQCNLNRIAEPMRQKFLDFIFCRKTQALKPPARSFEFRKERTVLHPPPPPPRSPLRPPPRHSAAASERPRGHLIIGG